MPVEIPTPLVKEVHREGPPLPPQKLTPPRTDVEVETPPVFLHLSSRPTQVFGLDAFATPLHVAVPRQPVQFTQAADSDPRVNVLSRMTQAVRGVFSQPAPPPPLPQGPLPSAYNPLESRRHRTNTPSQEQTLERKRREVAEDERASYRNAADARAAQQAAVDTHAQTVRIASAMSADLAAAKAAETAAIKTAAALSSELETLKKQLADVIAQKAQPNPAVAAAPDVRPEIEHLRRQVEIQGQRLAAALIAAKDAAKRARSMGPPRARPYNPDRGLPQQPQRAIPAYGTVSPQSYVGVPNPAACPPAPGTTVPPEIPPSTASYVPPPLNPIVVGTDFATFMARHQAD